MLLSVKHLMEGAFEMGKVLSVMVLTMLLVLTGCSETAENEYFITEVEHDNMVNYIAVESIIVNDEVFTLYEMQNPDEELLPTTLSICRYEANDAEYKIPCQSSTPVLNNGTFYHYGELLETERLSIEQLNELGLILEEAEE